MAEDWLTYLVANKSDKVGDREVNVEEGVKFARQYNFNYFTETSAKTKSNVRDLFMRIAKQLFLKNKIILPKSRVELGQGASIFSKNSSILLKDFSESNENIKHDLQTSFKLIKESKVPKTKKKEKKGCW